MTQKSVIPASAASAAREPGPIETLSRWVPDNALSRVSGMTIRFANHNSNEWC
jgi:hypothetical protein